MDRERKQFSTFLYLWECHPFLLLQAHLEESISSVNCFHQLIAFIDEAIQTERSAMITVPLNRFIYFNEYHHISLLKHHCEDFPRPPISFAYFAINWQWLERSICQMSSVDPNFDTQMKHRVRKIQNKSKDFELKKQKVQFMRFSDKVVTLKYDRTASENLN